MVAYDGGPRMYSDRVKERDVQSAASREHQRTLAIALASVDFTDTTTTKILCLRLPRRISIRHLDFAVAQLTAYRLRGEACGLGRYITISNVADASR